MADWAGKTLGKVLIHELIARGGMAEVYTGTHESFGRVAVKVMRGLLERDSDQLARFHREAGVSLRISNPTLCRCSIMPSPLNLSHGIYIPAHRWQLT
jgi:serine/threonine protein kinase